MPDLARGCQFSSACAGVSTHARILLQQFLTPGSPTRQSYSQAIHLVFSKESSLRCRAKHLFYLFLSSYFMVFFCCFVSDWHFSAPASSLPVTAFLASAGCCSVLREDKLGPRINGESGLSACSAITPLTRGRTTGNSLCCWWVWEVISAVSAAQGQAKGPWSS